MKHNLLLIFLLVSFTTVLFGQAPGIVVQAGVSTMYAKDGNVTLKNEAHYGWVVGADARLLDGDLYFIIGGHFHSTSLMSSSSPDFFKNNDWKILMTRLGLGFNLVKFSERFVLRSKAIGSINFIVDAPSKGLDISGYDKINDSFLGIGTGLGLTMGSFDLDLDFQYGVINAYYKQPKTTFDGFTLMFGVHF